MNLRNLINHHHRQENDNELIAGLALAPPTSPPQPFPRDPTPRTNTSRCNTQSLDSTSPPIRTCEQLLRGEGRAGERAQQHPNVRYVVVPLHERAVRIDPRPLAFPALHSIDSTQSSLVLGTYPVLLAACPRSENKRLCNATGRPIAGLPGQRLQLGAGSQYQVLDQLPEQSVGPNSSIQISTVITSSCDFRPPVQARSYL